MFNYSKGKLHIHVIILGAGFSRRYSETENKLLLQIDGKPMYRHVVDMMIDIEKQFDNIDSIVYVTQYHEIARDLKKDHNFINVIYNSHPERGISSSMQVGLAYSLKLKEGYMDEGEMRDLEFDIEDEKHAYMFMVSDQPYIKKDSILKFIKRFINSNKGIGMFSTNGVSGNPVIFMDKYIPDLMKLEGDRGGKKVAVMNYHDVFEFEVSQIENKDIDTKD